MMTEGEISPPSASSSASSSASYSSAGNNPMIPPFSSSASSSSSIWGPSPAPMSPSSSISSSCLSGDATLMDRPMTPASAVSATSPYLQIPAAFAAPPPPAAGSHSAVDIRPLGRDFAANGSIISPPPPANEYFDPEHRSHFESALNPAAESWNGRARTNNNNVGGPWNDTLGTTQQHNQSFQSQQQIQQQQQRLDLLRLLSGGANFDQLSKMIVNELLERLKDMIANQIAGAPPHVQQQALLEQIQALLVGGGGGMATIGGADHTAAKSLRGVGNQWSSNTTGFKDGENLIDSMKRTFDLNSANFRSLPSKRVEFLVNDAGDGRLPFPKDGAALIPNPARPKASAEIKDLIPAPVVEVTRALDIEEEPAVRLPIFSQLTK